MVHQRPTAGYSQYGTHISDASISPFDPHQYNHAEAAHYQQDTESFYTAHEYIEDAIEYEYPEQINQYQEQSYSTSANTYLDHQNEMSSFRPSNQQFYSTQQQQRRDIDDENTEFHQGPYHLAAIAFDQPTSRRSAYEDEGPSSLQTRLNSFEVPKRRRFAQSPARDIRIMPDLKQTAPDCIINQPSSSPSPTHTFNAQSSNLAPVSLPVQFEFTVPSDYVPMDTRTGSSVRHDVQGGLTKLPVTFLPNDQQKIFRFSHFNEAQTVAFRDLYLSDKNVVITAPTGAGKTTLFELAFLHMLNTDPQGKAVYIAPMKALCSERFYDWKKRLDSIKCKVLLMTGDTRLKLTEALEARLIVATPEKWDRMTRHARGNDRFMACLRLILIDEVHIVREMRRGAVVEVLVARMKAFSSKIRFIAVSATIPNADDFALWIGKRDNEPGLMTSRGEEAIPDCAQLYTFSEAFRPCPLTKYVYGFRNLRKDIWAFDRELNTKLPEIIQSHSNGKGAIVFCATRKMANNSAKSLAKDFTDKKDKNQELPWIVPPNRPESIDSDDPLLEELYACGIGFHHAGLALEDRHKVERAFLHGHLTILCSTSSLAVGVNLPAFLVVIRGTLMYDDTEWRDYGDLDVFQMMGRAGRPQFDTEGVCVIMTDNDHKKRWTDLLKGETTVESTLHHTLIEHANAEIVVRHDMSVRDLQDWLRQTFFYVRLVKKPEYYKLPQCEEVADAEEALYVTSHRIMAKLSENNLIEDYNKDDDQHKVISSNFGVIMAEYALRFETMLALLEVPRNSSVKQLIEVVSKGKELDRILLRSGEKSLYEQLREHQGIRFPPSGVEDVSDKITIILQAQLAGMSLDSMLRQQGQQLSLNIKGDVSAIMEHTPNVSRALLRIAIEKQDGGTARSAFELLRCTSGGAWEGTQAELRQVPGVGAAYMQTLGEAGITTIEEFARAKPERIQLLLNRTPGQVKKLTQEARRFPRFAVEVKESMGRIIEGEGVEIVINICIDLNHSKSELQKLNLKTQNSQSHYAAVLITTSNPRGRTCLWNRMTVEKLVAGATQLPTQRILLQSAEEDVIVTVGCDTLSGGVKESRVRSSCPSRKFPTITIREESENESEASFITELSRVESPRLTGAAVAPQKKRKILEESSGSNTASSRILKDLKQVDASIHSMEKDTIKPSISKSPEQKKAPAKIKSAERKLKRVSKTKEAKRQEEEDQKRDRDAMLKKLERMKQRKMASDRAAKEEKKRDCSEEQGIRQVREASLVEEDTYCSDESDEKPVTAERKKMKPSDWDFRVGTADPKGDDEVGTSPKYLLEESNNESWPLQRDQGDDFEDPGNKSDTGIDDHLSTQRVVEWVTIDDSDEETPTADQPGQDEIEGNPEEDFYLQCNEDLALDQYYPQEMLANGFDDALLDWQQYEGIEQDHQERVASLHNDEAEDILHNGEMQLTDASVTGSRVESNGPFAQAPLSQSTGSISFEKTSRLVDPEEDLKDFDADYLEELLNRYD